VAYLAPSLRTGCPASERNLEHLCLISRSKNRLFNQRLLVEAPQPASNHKQTLNQKRLFLQSLLEDEVAGIVFLLLII